MEKSFKYIKLIAILLLLVFTMSACEWLTKEPQDRLTKDQFWTKKEDVTGGLAASYDAFREVALKSFVWGELRADLVVFDAGAHGALDQIFNNNISPSNGQISWSGYYNAINLANTLMFYSGEVVDSDDSFTQQMKEEIDAEALFIRSLSYFYLVRLWKDVPLVIEPTVTDTLDLFLAKSPEVDVLNQVIEDLTYAKDIAVTDEYMETPVYYKGRANKYSTMALLADVYLWDEQYQLCVDYCDSIINLGKFGLESYNDWFTMYNPGNSMMESLFEIQYDDNYDNQDNPINGGSYIPTSGSSKVKLSPGASSDFFDPEDLRKVGTKTATWKYLGITTKSSAKRNSSERDANFIYYRYADVLLMKAEALCELDRFAEANDLVRMIAERAGITYVNALTKDDLRLAILNERAKEFIMEGKRWFDLLRYAKRNDFEKKDVIGDLLLSRAEDILEAVVLKTKAYDPDFYYLPIPENELKSNPSLVQNPFYDR